MSNIPTVPALITLGNSPIDIMHFLDSTGILRSWIDNSGTGQGNLVGGGGSSSALSGSVTTTGTTSDTVSIENVTANSHYSITATNAAAAADIGAGNVFVASKGNGFVVVAHSATPSMTFDILATAD